MKNCCVLPRKIVYLLVTGLTLFAQGALAGPWSQEPYKKLNSLCDGFPQLPIGTMENSCMGLVMDNKTLDPVTGLGLKFPRKIIQIPGSENFLVTDMGGWMPKNRGRVLKLIKGLNNSYSLQTLFSGLYLPYDIDLGPDGKVYVGEMGKIFRFDPRVALPEKEIVVDGLPTNIDVANMHPLNSFSFGQGTFKNDLFVNVGSPSDGCTKSAPGLCQESEFENAQASIWHYEYLGTGRWSPTPSVFARGLRNSMAQVIHPSGTFLQAENGRDLKSAAEPHEELNIIEAQGHYGFPYCYNFIAQVPEWTNSAVVNCQDPKFKRPHTLLPPRTAPLDMFYYSGKMFPQLRNHLLMTWHGYMVPGNRIVSYPTDEAGKPRLASGGTWTFNVWDPNQENGKLEVAGNAKGGIFQWAPHFEITTDWFAKKGLRPNGSPVGITEASDGSIWIVSDYNKTITRLAKGQNWRPTADEARGDLTPQKRGATPEEISRIKSKLLNNPENLRRWNYVAEGILKQNCTSCHSGFISEGFKKGDPWSYFEYILSRPGWVIPGEASKSEMYLRMSSAKSGTPMPPKGLLSAQDQLTIQRFIDRL